MLAGIRTVTALQTMTFAQLKYIVPDLIVEGCVLLAGKPKHGKSWFALDLGLAVASARYCLGDKKCEEGDVLYLALEDGDRRLQRRITKLLPTLGGKWPERFNYETKWPRENEGGIEAIDAWCEAHPDARLVVVDVLAKFRAPSTKKNATAAEASARASVRQPMVMRSRTPDGGSTPRCEAKTRHFGADNARSGSDCKRPATNSNGPSGKPRKSLRCTSNSVFIWGIPDETR